MSDLDIVWQSVHMFFACVALAFVEIQVEGKHGWAKNLPTWRGQPKWAKPNSLFFRVLGAIFKQLSGGNQLTGYHLSVMSFLLFIVTFPVAFAEDKPRTLLLCLGWLSIMSVVWDFLWFVFNEHYGVRRFKPENIAWHPRWLGPVPVAYYFGLGSGCGLIVLATRQPVHAGIILGIMAVGVMLSILVGYVFIKRI